MEIEAKLENEMFLNAEIRDRDQIIQTVKQ